MNALRIESDALTEAIEITTFRLAGCSCAAFIEANADVDAWLARQPGYRSRRIAEMNDGTIADVLIWDTVADGAAAAARLMVDLADSAVHAMIDQATVSWTVSPVRHRAGHVPSA